jgi:uncharacterized protein YxeA
MLQELSLGGAAPLPIPTLLFNLAIGAVLAIILRWHFVRFGSTLSNRNEFSQVFPLIILTTILIISVVKSSLALSLGLVGALSIVRFRTPIKEPEELAYLFAAIAIGLGLGASQTVATVAAILVILMVISILRIKKLRIDRKNFYLSIETEIENADAKESVLNRINAMLGKYALACDLRRFDLRGKSLEAMFFIDVTDLDGLEGLTTELRQAFPNISVTFLDQSRLPGI